ncbi:MAG: hypothetical protein M1838_004538 [Thelocarpon superellum]|nr:MAG: hypothetical protein M1838_004538 [Thelocarpon superellum]
MSELTGAPLAEAVFTVIGSLLSFIGAGFILICYALLPQKRHFRHALIINLAISDFINGLNNSVSGLYIVARHSDMVDGPGCVANGFIGQLSVQATDCTILLIAGVTLLGLRNSLVIPDASTSAKIMLCCTTWILPIITSFTALGLKLYHPVNGNWCWIQQEPTYLRYVLTHMWRFFVIVASTGIYIYIYFYLRRHFREIRMLGGPVLESNSVHTHDLYHDKIHDGVMDRDDSELGSSASERSRAMQQDHATDTITAASAEMSDLRPLPSVSGKGVIVTTSMSNESYTPAPQRNSVVAIRNSIARGRTLASTESQIKKTLLLNAYPIMYIILWLPGIANRIAEASGHPTIVLGIMQASTQYVGLANAITYGLNERILDQLRNLIARGKR